MTDYDTRPTAQRSEGVNISVYKDVYYSKISVNKHIAVSSQHVHKLTDYDDDQMTTPLIRGGQTTAHGSHAAHHQIPRGPRDHLSICMQPAESDII